MSNPATIKAKLNRQIEIELRSCAEKMGPREWDKHREWVTHNVVSSAKEWLAQQVSRGAL
jgi:hypothetical protein